MTVYPADVVLFEGILAFYSQEVRDLFQMKLFVDTDADTRLSRRGACALPERWVTSEKGRVTVAKGCELTGMNEEVYIPVSPEKHLIGSSALCEVPTAPRSRRS